MRNRISSIGFILCVFVLWLQPCWGRPVRMWGYDEMWEKSDLVVIAKPIATKDLDEEIDLMGTRAVGQETTFQVTVCLKGKVAKADGDKKTIIKLRHYKGGVGMNGLGFLHFAKDDKSQYLMFLKRVDKGKRLEDALYEPFSGHADPNISVERLRNP